LYDSKTNQLTARLQAAVATVVQQQGKPLALKSADDVKSAPAIVKSL